MNRRKALLLAVVLSTAILSAGFQAGTVFTHGHATTPVVEGKTPKQTEVKELLLLMDTDKNGKISKQEWMKFMEAEFDRLDNDKSGELGLKELLRSRITADMSSAVNAP
jgi:Ca2+-binding EF-hand superfamily protein